MVSANHTEASPIARRKANAPSLRVQLSRRAFRMLNAFAPRIAGRRAADAFGFTRGYGLPVSDRVPLGATETPIEGNADIDRAYCWEGGASRVLVHNVIAPNFGDLQVRLDEMEATALLIASASPCVSCNAANSGLTR